MSVLSPLHAYWNITFPLLRPIMGGFARLSFSALLRALLSCIRSKYCGRGDAERGGFAPRLRRSLFQPGAFFFLGNGRWRLSFLAAPFPGMSLSLPPVIVGDEGSIMDMQIRKQGAVAVQRLRMRFGFKK